MAVKEKDKVAMHPALWEKLSTLDASGTARRGGCQFDTEKNRFLISMLCQDYSVDIRRRTISRKDDAAATAAASFVEQLCILSYLIRACDMPPADKLVKPERLEAGQFFFRGHHVLPTQELAQAFGTCPERLYAAADSLRGIRKPYGDASIEIYVLPRIPITFVVWAGDEEFEARASILFDETVSHQLPLDALQAVTGLAVNGLIQTR